MNSVLVSARETVARLAQHFAQPNIARVQPKILRERYFGALRDVIERSPEAAEAQSAADELKRVKGLFLPCVPPKSTAQEVSG